MKKLLLLLRRGESGQALVEFGVFSSLFVVFFIAITDLSFQILSQMIVLESATSGASYGAAWGNQNDTSGMVTWANQAATGLVLQSLPTASVFYTCTPGGTPVSATTTCSGGTNLQYVKVTTTATSMPMFHSPYIGVNQITSTVIYRVPHKTQ